jgi:hypothetical protein
MPGQGNVLLRGRLVQLPGIKTAAGALAAVPQQVMADLIVCHGGKVNDDFAAGTAKPATAFRAHLVPVFVAGGGDV